MPETFAEILEAVDHLPAEEQADLLEVVRKRLAAKGRLRMIEEVADARAEFANGLAKLTVADEIMREIES